MELTDDFSTGSPSSSLWDQVSGGSINDAFSGRTKSLFFGGINSRQAATKALNTINYKAVKFDLIYGNGLNGGEYLDPDEEVILEYSTNYGNSWTTLQRYSFPASWTTFKLNLPIAAQTESTQLRWRQTQFNNSLSQDSWALDNVSISSDSHELPLSADFTTGPNDGLWNDMSGAIVSNTFEGRSQSLFFGGLNRRQATTVNLNTIAYKALQFDIIYGNGTNGGDYLDPSEEVSLEYSSDDGRSWTKLVDYTFPGNWTTFTVNFPTAAQTNSTQLRWRQSQFNNTANQDVWAIDNIILRSENFIPPTTADFSTGPNAGLWRDMTGAIVNNTFAGRTQSLFFGGLNSRSATTVDLNTRLYNALQFDLIYGNGINGGEYLDPDEEVTLEYSTDSGNSWTRLQHYSFPGIWTSFRINLPTAAQTDATQIRWRQSQFNNGLNQDVWAIDNLTFNAGAYTPPTTADFSTGINAGLWEDMAGAIVNNTFTGRTQSLFFGGLYSRQATSVALNTTLYKALEFDLIYGNDINGGNYVDPDEEVVLEYSTDSGSSWSVLQRYTFPGSWTTFKLNLPTAAQSENTQLRWRQVQFNNSLNQDVWAIDNVSLNTMPSIPPTSVDFSTGPNSGLWKDMAGAVVNNTFFGRNQSLFFGGLNARQVISVDLNTIRYKSFEFDLIYGNGTNGGELLDSFEEVTLDYSTDNGASWSPLRTLTNTGRWSRTRIDLPTFAQTETTQLRWRQAQFNNSLNQDVWAIDNIRLISSDTTAPVIRSISCQGNEIVVIFSEPVDTASLVSDRFSVKVGRISRPVIAVVPGESASQLRLTISGSQPNSSDNINLIYTDPNPGIDDISNVVQDQSGNDMASIRPPGLAVDTLISASTVVTLASSFNRVVLTGTDSINANGNNANNIISGNSSANLLDGLAGRDEIAGGIGADIFRFSTLPNSTSNRDRLIDFNPAEGDRIELKSSIFKKLTKIGALDASNFKVGIPTSPNHFILYDPTSGSLTYDNNGNAPGGSSIFANLPPGIMIDNNHINVV